MKESYKNIKKFNKSNVIFGITYFLLYFLYLFMFVEIETEFVHWITLVILPFMGIIFLQKKILDNFSLKEAFEKVGLLHKDKLFIKIIIGALFGLGLGTLQLLLSSQKNDIWNIIITGKVIYSFPLAVLLMLITAGFTEEFFFRGIIQTSLHRVFNKNIWPILISSILFGIYHFPYAYLLTTWSSYGNIGAAIQEGVFMSIIIGLVLGFIYARSKNLVVPIIAHSCFNAMVGMILFV